MHLKLIVNVLYAFLKKKIEDDTIEYTLGPSMMEPDSREQSNEKGFCKNHYKLLYEKNNRLSLALILDTHILENNKKLFSHLENKLSDLNKNMNTSIVKSFTKKFKSKPSDTNNITNQLIYCLSTLEDTCVICEKISYTMERYVSVIYHLWQNEKDFRKLLKNKKGFCLYHFKVLLEGIKKHLSAKKQSEFLMDILPMQVDNMKRIQEEVNWFTKKFDYRNNNAPWGNSKDAIPRAIEKNVGFSRLE
jgi:hypothetical protein